MIMTGHEAGSWATGRIGPMWVAVYSLLACCPLWAEQPAERPPSETFPVAGEPCASSCMVNVPHLAPRKLGTAIDWYADRDEAVRVAKQRGKLLFVMQLSGNFAREEFT